MRKTRGQVAREQFHEAFLLRQAELPCRDPRVNADDWFAPVGSKRAERARSACFACPIVQECQWYAIDAGIPNGTWGGIDEREREELWRMSGGKPADFNDELDAAILPLLQSRRDFESFDEHHSDPYTDGDEAA